MSNRFLRRLVNGEATKEQAKDTGMALVLVLLLFWMFRRKSGWVELAIVVHVVNMIAPQIFRWAAVIWFGFSHVMGAVVSKVILAIVFFLVTPIGVVRRLFGKDSLKLRAFKRSTASVMTVRNHKFVAQDLEQPY